jgi:uncharacterized protein (TIGR02217 family)
MPRARNPGRAPITKPVAGSGARRARRSEQTSAAGPIDTDHRCRHLRAAPGEGIAVTAGFEFDVPVRFDTDALDVTLDLERLGSITSIPLLEIRR